MTEGRNQTGILFIGYFLSEFGRGRCVCEDLSMRFQEHGYRIITTSKSTNRYLRILDMITTIITRRKDYDVASVEVYNGSAFIWAELSCRILKLLNKPFVITLHGARMLQFAQRWPGRVRRLLVNADMVTTPSKLFQEKFSSWRQDIIYLPNAIELDNYNFRLRSNPAARIGWLRKFEKIYNPILAVKTLANLLSDFPSAKLIMGGGDIHDGSSDDVKKIAINKNLVDQLDIQGFIEHNKKIQWFDSFDIFINTTNVESFGIAVLEAAASGLCIVSTNVGELPNIWEDGKDLLFVSPDDPDAMANAIKRILTEPGLGECLSRNACEIAEQYDWSVILPKWEKLFSELVHK